MHRGVWGVSGALALAVVPFGLVPGFTVEARIYLGSGRDQRRVETVRRTFTLLGGEAGSWYVVVLALAAVAVLAAAAGLSRPDRWQPLLVIALAGVVAPSLMTQEFLGSGRLVLWKDGLDEVRRAAQDRYSGQDPTISLAAEGGPGWTGTMAVLIALTAVAAFALGRGLRLPAWIAAPVLLAGTILVFVAPARDCGGSGVTDPSATGGPLGSIGIGLCAALLPLGIGLLTRRRWLAGVSCVVLGPLVAYLDLFLLAARNCAFY